MDPILITEFEKGNCIKNKENNNSDVYVISGASVELFSSYVALLCQNGFALEEKYTMDTHSYAALQKDGQGMFINYFGSVSELYIAYDKSCNYFSYENKLLDAVKAPQITQIELEDFGMSYAVRLSDGRFIVIDGGRDFECEADKLFKCLLEGSDGKAPVIAMWIMTHPHSDHFHAFMPFMDKYGDRVTVESFLLNFPEKDDFEHYPQLASKDYRFEDSSGVTNIPRMFERMYKTGAPIYTAHTGQRYEVGDAKLHVLASIDDTIHLTDSINATSLVFRMELGGQVILWATDAPFSTDKLCEKYGEYLKADILQVPHHGFQGGTIESEIAGYKLIRPEVCLLPVSDYNAYTVFCAYKESTSFLMTKMGVKEMITGTPQRTITLPYAPTPWGEKELERKYTEGHGRAGACTWFFSELNTANDEDFVFTLLNTTLTAATVWIDLYFEDYHKNVRDIKFVLRSSRRSKINIVGDDVDGDAIFFNWMSLKDMGVPQNSDFTVRFRSDIPIIVSHKTHRPAYNSNF